MNIHEYQAKSVLRAFGVPIASGFPAFSSDEAVEAAKKLPGPIWVVKTQIHAGGRGKGPPSRKPRLGTKAACGSPALSRRSRTFASQMLGATLVTAQTGPSGKEVSRLYVEDGATIDRDSFFGAGRSADQPGSVPVSTEGGVNIEEVAHATPERIHTFTVDPRPDHAPSWSHRSPRVGD